MHLKFHILWCIKCICHRNFSLESVNNLFSSVLNVSSIYHILYSSSCYQKSSFNRHNLFLAMLIWKNVLKIEKHEQKRRKCFQEYSSEKHNFLLFRQNSARRLNNFPVYNEISYETDVVRVLSEKIFREIKHFVLTDIRHSWKEEIHAKLSTQ